jgi:hypothetical protein
MVNGISRVLGLLAMAGASGILLVSAAAVAPAWAQGGGYTGNSRSGGTYTAGTYSGGAYGRQSHAPALGGLPPRASRRAASGGDRPRPVWRSSPSVPSPWRSNLSPGALPQKTLAPMVKDYISYSGYYGAYGAVAPVVVAPEAAAKPPADPARPGRRQNWLAPAQIKENPVLAVSARPPRAEISATPAKDRLRPSQQTTKTPPSPA